MKKRSSSRRRNGTSMAELPMTLWVFIFFMMLPMIDLVTLSYRAILAYEGVREATGKASLADSFTSAATAANAQLGASSAAWSGIGYSGTNVFAVQVDQSGNEIQGAANTPWASTNKYQ